MLNCRNYFFLDKVWGMLEGSATEVNDDDEVHDPTGPFPKSILLRGCKEHYFEYLIIFLIYFLFV